MKNASPSRPAPSYPIGSVDNLLKLLVLFRSQKEIRMTDAAQHLGVAKSTAHRLLAMLEYHEFVVQDPVSRLYLAGPTLVDVGLSVAGGMDTSARPVMKELSRSVGETVNLLVLRGREVLFVDCVESAQALRIGSRIGVVLPAHCTSGGKAILSQLTLENLRQLYLGGRLEVVTEASITTRSQLEKQLVIVRRRGYATNFGESENELSAVGSAILDRSGRVRGAVAIAAPRARLGEEDVESVGRQVIEAAKEIGRLLA